MVLAYDGDVNGAPECGTSFAAPRVAWLLALRETRDSDFDPQNWEDELYRLITSGRTPSGGLGQLWLSITQILDGAIPNDHLL